MPDPRETPAMQQFYRFKQRHPGCMLLFRMGDFYETFDDDALQISKVLGLTLTQRTSGIPMAGVPHHQIDAYLKRLVAKGIRVAVCDQLIDAKLAKGLVPRAVTRVITPGTIVDESLLEGDAPVAVACVYAKEAHAAPRKDKAKPGAPQEGLTAPALHLAVADISTGESTILSCPVSALADELARRGVREVLHAEGVSKDFSDALRAACAPLGASLTQRPAWHFRPQESIESLRSLYKVSTLAGFGLREDDPGVFAAGALARYLVETQTLSEQDRAGVPEGALVLGSLAHLRPPVRSVPTASLVIDAVSLRALEVERTLRGELQSGTLLSIFLDAAVGKGACRTPMGRRELRTWLVAPSREREEITSRHSAVAVLAQDRTLSREAGELLSQIQDVARIAARIAMARATPRDVVALGRSCAVCDKLGASIASTPALQALSASLRALAPLLTPLAGDIARLCVDAPPAHLREGGLFRDGVDATLDEARLLQRDAGAWLAQYQTRLIAEHALPNLKVGFNKVAGYFIELPEAQARSAPPTLRRMQTLRNAERYTTPELQDFERKVTTAESRALDRERELFAALCAQAGALTREVAVYAHLVARLDALLALADKASHRAWVRPAMVDEPMLRISQGRHPVLDEILGQSCVPNDCTLGKLENAAPLALITGPNMAGKSTYIRQVALLTILAHAGSFVPAQEATIGITDRVFTRIGADDALHAGQSTFMVEMVETANILHHATPASLIVLDEVGRGTSTLDGLSLAWAIVEHLAHNDAQPRTLFATHYHELTDLEDRFPGAVTNLHVAVREWPAGGDEYGHSEIVFLHRILTGRTDQSYGLHVARLAGMPANVITRAREVLGTLNVQHTGAQAPTTSARTKKARGDTSRIPAHAADQLALFTLYAEHPSVNMLRELKLDAMTPLQAFDELRKLHQAATQEKPGTDAAERSD